MYFCKRVSHAAPQRDRFNRTCLYMPPFTPDRHVPVRRWHVNGIDLCDTLHRRRMKTSRSQRDGVTSLYVPSPLLWDMFGRKITRVHAAWNYRQRPNFRSVGNSCHRQRYDVTRVEFCVDRSCVTVPAFMLTSSATVYVTGSIISPCDTQDLVGLDLRCLKVRYGMAG